MQNKFLIDEQKQIKDENMKILQYNLQYKIDYQKMRTDRDHLYELHQKQKKNFKELSAKFFSIIINF